MWFCDENNPRFVINKPRPMLLGVARFAWDRQPHLRYFFRIPSENIRGPLAGLAPKGLKGGPAKRTNRLLL